MSIRIGDIQTRNRVFLAPMSGVSDEPFRRLAHRHGAGLVVSEMVASEELVRQRPDVVRRTAGADVGAPFVIQLAGREPQWMAEGARIARDLGADVIDINMGCPAREVTGGLSGSALMRDPGHAAHLIEATVEAVDIPVTLKMRLGWDHDTINAPQLARRAQDAGVQMITVHGRTRCQFYKGKADWAAIAAVRQSTTLPLIANGDGKTLEDVHCMLAQSGADGVMIGRGAYGRPWIVGELAEQLDPGNGIAALSLHDQFRVVSEHHDAMLTFYGHAHGGKIARKHLGWYIAHWLSEGYLTADEARLWRWRLVREEDCKVVQRMLVDLLDEVSVSEPKAA
jgi:nifR3 family TIM-barrel protein